MLRSLGLSRKQLRRMISIEAILITLAAVVLGMVSGGVIGSLSAQIIMSSMSASAPLVLDLPYVWYVVILIVGVLAAMLASALPAARSARPDTRREKAPEGASKRRPPAGASLCPLLCRALYSVVLVLSDSWS